MTMHNKNKFAEIINRKYSMKPLSVSIFHFNHFAFKVFVKIFGPGIPSNHVVVIA